jgi:hypothetical protein
VNPCLVILDITVQKYPPEDYFAPFGLIGRQWPLIGFQPFDQSN